MYLWLAAVVIVSVGAQDSFQAPGACLQPPDPGNCGGPVREKWFFYAGDQECRQFGYTGCQGNDNKFDTLEDCMRICTGVAELKEEPLDTEIDGFVDEDDDFEIPLHLIDQVDRDESYVFSKKNINPQDLSALQEVISEMPVSALQAREGEEEVPEEPLEVVENPSSVDVKEEVTSGKTVEEASVSGDKEGRQNGDASDEKRKAEKKEAEEENDGEDDVYDPLEEIKAVSQDERFVFQDKNIDTNDLHALQEVMAEMNAMAMEVKEEEEATESEMREDNSEQMKPEIRENGVETGAKQHETEETGAGDEINGSDIQEDEDAVYDPLEVINNADQNEGYTFRKGAMTPEDLSTLQELVSQMDTRAVEEDEREDVEEEKPHPLSYLPDDSRDTVTETPEGSMAKISAHGMNSNLMTAKTDQLSTTDTPIVTTNGEIIKTTSPDALEASEELEKGEVQEKSEALDEKGREEPVYNRLEEEKQSLEDETRRITFMMPSESSKMGPFAARLHRQKSLEADVMQRDDHPPIPPPPFFFNRLMTKFRKSRMHMPSREDMKKVMARKFFKKARELRNEETQLKEKWPVFRIFMAHFKPKSQGDDAEFLQRRVDVERRREYERKDDRQERHFYSDRKPRFHEEINHEERDFGRFERMGKSRFHRMEDPGHLSQISPKNKFTLLQVFVNKKENGPSSQVPPPRPPSPPLFHPPHLHYPQPPIMPHHPVLHPKHLSSIVPPYHPQLSPNTFLNIHPFYPHKPTISNRPPWRIIPFKNHPPSPPEIVLTTESAGDSERGSYACFLPLDTGMCKTYQVRWYFNKYRQQCELFFFGGCGGNANRFESIHDCKQICSGDTVESDQPSSGEEDDLGPRLASVKKLLEKEAARREHGETLVVTSPVYENEEIVTTPPQPIHRPENKAEAEQQLEESKEEAKEVGNEDDQSEGSPAESYIIAGMRSESSSEFIMVIVIMSVVGLAVVLLVAVTVSHFIKKMNSSKKEKVLEAVIKTQMCADIPKMVYSPPSVTPLPPDVHTP